ncbi:MAG: TlpA family protein disulfide reductase [Acidobacteriota bacterium]|nr:TlpA family protein disulfide reductase [Acidobacteriota bacterium]
MRLAIKFTVVLTLLLCGSGPRAGARQKTETEPPKDAAFKLKGLDGKTYESAGLRGEVLVVSFGATWCVPCTWELVAIEELKQEYEGKPVRFFWVSIETKERTSDNLLRHYAKERQLTIPVLRDPDASLFSLFSTSTRIPLVVFYDREGRFVAPAHRGMSQDITVYKQMVRDRVDALLKTEKQGAGL